MGSLFRPRMGHPAKIYKIKYVSYSNTLMCEGSYSFARFSFLLPPHKRCSNTRAMSEMLQSSLLVKRGQRRKAVENRSHAPSLLSKRFKQVITTQSHILRDHSPKGYFLHVRWSTNQWKITPLWIISHGIAIERDEWASWTKKKISRFHICICPFIFPLSLF